MVRLAGSVLSEEYRVSEGAVVQVGELMGLVKLAGPVEGSDIAKDSLRA